MKETSYIEISKSALESNIKFIKNYLNPEVELVSVVKGNAYGHGIEEFVPLAHEVGINSFAVFSAYEAFRVIKETPKLDRLMIMGFIDDDELEEVIAKGIEFFVYDQNRLLKAIEICKKEHLKTKIHLEVETGLNRTGFTTEELDEVQEIIAQNKDYIVNAGVCSHLAGAENISNYYRIKNQIISFQKSVKNLEQNGLNFETKHLACSAAIINYPRVVFNLVRIGIMQYGFWPSNEVKMAFMVKQKSNEDPLKRVITWKSKVMSLKKVSKGEYIGYGNSLQAEVDMKIAGVPVGYAHGFNRSLSNQGKVLIKGKRLDVIGVVNMNMMLIDITSVETIEIGDEVVLIGSQGNQNISVASFSDLSSQLNYEMLSRLPNDINRKIIA